MRLVAIVKFDSVPKELSTVDVVNEQILLQLYQLVTLEPVDNNCFESKILIANIKIVYLWCGKRRATHQGYSVEVYAFKLTDFIS